jgi:glycosyltransferase involved in cell wall biosynthesis
MEVKKPTVSVVLCVYNDHVYLSAAIESILSQSFDDFEFIIVDDGSIDASLSVAQSFSLDPRVIVLSHSGNKGLVAALHTGLQRAVGRFIARMDSDDISLPNRFQEQVAFLRSNPEVDVVGSNVKIFQTPVQSQEDSLPCGPTRSRVISLPSSPCAVQWSMHFYCCLAHPSVMMRREVLLRQSYVDDFKYAEDYDLWTRLLSFGQRMANIDRFSLSL